MAPNTFEPLTLTPVTFSLTAGTDIPAPPATPPSPPRSPSPGCGPLSSHPTTPIRREFSHADANGRAPAPALDAALAPPTTTTTTVSAPASAARAPSPSASTATKRPSSVRKFLSLRALHPRAAAEAGRRPDTAQSASVRSPTGPPQSPGLARKRSSGWFGSAGRRRSVVPGSRDGEAGGAVAVEEKEEEKGPPPTIPEWEKLGEGLDGGDLGAEDLFKNIK